MNVPGPDRLSDEAILVELRDMKQRIAVLIAGMSERVERQMETYRKIIAAVQESDEHQMRMGRDAPNDLPVAPAFETLTHEVALDPDDVTEIERCGE